MSIEDEEPDFDDLDSESSDEEVGLDAIEVDDSEAYSEDNNMPDDMFDDEDLNEEEA